MEKDNFIDTQIMRILLKTCRGASVTDIVIKLLRDDGAPQAKEGLIVLRQMFQLVAINKIDKPTADPGQRRQIWRQMVLHQMNSVR